MGERTLIGELTSKAVEQAVLVANLKRYRWAAGFLLPAVPILWLVFQIISQVNENTADLKTLTEYHQRLMELP